MNKKARFFPIFLLIFGMAFLTVSLNADSQFRIDVLPQNSNFILQGKPSETVGVTAFMQEGLDYLKNQKAVYTVAQNPTWQNFLKNNGVRLRPGADRYALRSDRYYRFFHVNISAVKPRQSSTAIPWNLIKKVLSAGVLTILGVGVLVYLFKPLKPSLKVKSKNISKSISLTKKITRKKIKTKKVKKIIKKKIKKTIQHKKTVKKISIKKSVRKPVKKKPLVKSRKKTVKKTTAAPVVFKKSKSILIKPTAKRIKNIKLARQLAKKSLTLDDFIQEDLANNPSGLLKPPTKTELRSSSDL